MGTLQISFRTSSALYEIHIRSTQDLVSLPCRCLVLVHSVLRLLCLLVLKHLMLFLVKFNSSVSQSVLSQLLNLTFLINLYTRRLTILFSLNSSLHFNVILGPLYFVNFVYTTLYIWFFVHHLSSLLCYVVIISFSSVYPHLILLLLFKIIFT